MPTPPITQDSSTGSSDVRAIKSKGTAHTQRMVNPPLALGVKPRVYSTTVRGRMSIDDPKIARYGGVLPKYETDVIDDPKIARHGGVLPKYETDDIDDPKIARHGGILPKTETNVISFKPTDYERGLLAPQPHPVVRNTQVLKKPSNAKPKIQRQNAPKLPYKTISNAESLSIAASLLIRKVGWKRQNQVSRFDNDYWEPAVGMVETDDSGRQWGIVDRFVLKSTYKGKPLHPSEAIEAMFSEAQKWSFDCAQLVQALLLYTLLHTIGKEAFDKLPRELDGSFVFKPHYSTLLYQPAQPNLGIKLAWERDAEGILRRKPSGEPENRSTDALLKEAPVGSIITFKNYDASALGRAFENENCIKIGPDTYIAHGLGVKDHVLYNLYFSRNEIEDALARDALKSNYIPKGYIENNIKIYDIIPVPMPEK